MTELSVHVGDINFIISMQQLIGQRTVAKNSSKNIYRRTLQVHQLHLTNLLGRGAGGQVSSRIGQVQNMPLTYRTGAQVNRSLKVQDRYTSCSLPPRQARWRTGQDSLPTRQVLWWTGIQKYRTDSKVSAYLQDRGSGGQVSRSTGQVQKLQLTYKTGTLVDRYPEVQDRYKSYSLPTRQGLWWTGIQKFRTGTKVTAYLQDRGFGGQVSRSTGQPRPGSVQRPTEAFPKLSDQVFPLKNLRNIF
jgi:hypothetical protein